MGTKKHLLFWTRRLHHKLLTDPDKSYLVQVVGEYIEIANRFRAFIHYSKRCNYWYINELHTGINFAEGKTREDAISDARASIRKVAEHEFCDKFPTHFVGIPTDKRECIIEDADIDIYEIGEKGFLKWILKTVRRNGRLPKPYTYQEGNNVKYMG